MNGKAASELPTRLSNLDIGRNSGFAVIVTLYRHQRLIRLPPDHRACTNGSFLIHYGDESADSLCKVFQDRRW